MVKAELAWKGTGGAGERTTCSFLVRVWSEPRETDEEGAAVRGYLRNLQTGEEQYVTEPAAIGKLIERSLEEVEAAADRQAERDRGKAVPVDS